MYDILKSLTNFLKPATTTIDNVGFKLHYKLTTFVLVMCSILVTCKQFFGDPINCFTGFKDEVPENVLNNFCWMHSTFTLPQTAGMKVGTEVVAPGVNKYTPKQERVFHQYYQWVCFFLFFQAMSFYIPRFLWKSLEGGKIHQVVLGLDQPIIGVDDRNTKLHQLASYFVDNLGNHRTYALSFFLCELLNFINVISQIFITDRFLGGEFTEYGTEVVRFAQMDQDVRIDPMIRVFPRLTKCTFHKFGPSGDIQLHDALCVLSLNIINEKVFVVIWFWFIILAVLSSIAIIYRIAWLCFDQIRHSILTRFNRKIRRSQLRSLSHKLDVSDWLIMHLLSKNMHSLNFRDFLKELDKMMNPNPYNDNKGNNQDVHGIAA